MKIVFIINSLSERAGSERVACNLANEFDCRYNNITIINRDSEFSDVSYPLNNNIEVKKIRGNLIFFYIKLRRILTELNPDYVIIHNMGKLSIFCSLLNLKNIKFISLEHISFVSRNVAIRILSRILYKNIFSVVSITMNDFNIYNKWHNNVHYIPNFSSFDRKNNSYKIYSKKIIAIGRLTYQKNFQLLIESWANIQKYRLDGWELHIYGEGEEFSVLSNLIKERNLDKSTFLNANTSDIECIYDSAAFLVMSSRYEGLPMVLIEAQFFGIPLVSFDCPTGPAEIILNDVNGILVDNQDIDALSEAMLELINNSDRRISLSKGAFINAKKYSVEIILEKWYKVLSS